MFDAKINILTLKKKKKQLQPQNVIKSENICNAKENKKAGKKRFERKKSKFAGTIHGTEIGV